MLGSHCSWPLRDLDAEEVLALLRSERINMEEDPMDPQWLTKVRKTTALLLGLLVLTIIVGSAMPAIALEKHNGAALEWSLPEPLPDTVDVDEQFTVKVTVKNEGTVDLTGGNKTTVELQVKGKIIDSHIVELSKNKSTTINFKVTITQEGDHELKLNSHYRYGLVSLYNENGGKTSTIGVVKAEVVEEPINWVPLIAVIAIVIVGILVYFLMDKRKKKAEEEKRLAEQVRRQELIRKKEEEIAKKVQVRAVVGKQPRDYYVLRRQKYATLRPAGMTSSGLNILRRQKTKAEIEAETKIVCPKCGTELPSEGAVCRRCNATERIEAIRHTIRSYKSQADVDFGDAEALLRKAEHRLNWSDYNMANDIVQEAESKTEEIWAAAAIGATVASTVVEYSEAKGPSLDAKVIGLEGEKTVMPIATLAAEVPLAKEMEPAGEPCPECGNPMDNGECILCSFDEKLNSCWTVIEKAEMDGANMAEVKELCRQANNARERGSDELAVRYLSRACRFSEEIYHEHAQSKTDGIIQFTNALISQLKGMGEDVSMAEQMMVKAKQAMEAEDYETARSMAAKADGYLKQMKEDSHRKQIQELLPEVEAGAASSPDAQNLLGKAKKLIAANELEGAVDLLEAAKSKL